MDGCVEMRSGLGCLPRARPRKRKRLRSAYWRSRRPFRFRQCRRWIFFRDDEITEMFIEGLRRAGIPE